MEAAAQHHLAYYVLDRPDPLNGETIEGPMLDPERTNFVAYFPMPVRMGMTLGEMARMFNAENKIGSDLHVIAMQGWHRGEWFGDTGLPRINPSPNLRSEEAAVLYPGLEILQAAGVSVGRGTDAPFERFGAPWMNGEQLATELNRRNIAGVRFESDRFTPASELFAGKMCEGVRVILADRSQLRSMRMGMEIAAALARLHPAKFDPTRMIPLLGNSATIELLQKGEAPEGIVTSWRRALERFGKMRAKYLLY
jgi:uncharacterized protein YbbC (DUF1343 family)